MLGLFLSAVRGALLAITVILFVYVWLSPGAKARKFLYYGAFLVVLSMLSWVYTLGTLGVNAGENRLNVVDVDPTLTGRTVVWLETVDTLLSSRSNFVFGVGLGAVEVFAPEAGGEKDDVFNSLLTAWMNFGLVGLFSYVALLWWFFRRLRRLEMTAQRALLIAMLFGFVCSDMFDTRWQQTFINWFIAYLFYLFSCSWPILAYDSKAARMLKLTAPLRSTP
jgi:O-antigen ligase